MASQRKQTKEWEPWLNFTENGIKVTCIFCAGTFNYKRERAFAHFGYGSKSERSICRSMPRHVRHRFANCTGFVPLRMDVGDMYEGEPIQSAPSRATARASSSEATENEVTGGIDGGRAEEGANVSEGNDILQMSNSLAGSNSTRSRSLRQ